MEDDSNQAAGYDQLPPPYSVKGDENPTEKSSTLPQQSTGYDQQYGQQNLGYQGQPAGYGATAGGYNQQPVGYAQPPYGQQSYPVVHQNNPAVVMVSSTGQPYAVPADTHVYKSYGGQIALACFVFWCCGWLLGLIAFILAMMASSSANSGQHQEAENLGKASCWVSIAGVIIGTIVIAIIIGVSISNTN